MQQTSTQWDHTTKIIVTILLIITLIVVIYISSNIIPLLIFAAMIAFLLTPIVDFLNSKAHIPRALSIVLVYLIFLISIAIILTIVVPALINAIQAIDYLELARGIINWARQFLESMRHISFGGRSVDFSRYVDEGQNVLNGILPAQSIPSIDKVISGLSSAVQWMGGLASTVVGTVSSVFLSFLLIFICSIYLTADFRRIGRSFEEMIPEAYRPEYRAIAVRIKNVWIAYFRGQLILMLTVGTMVALADSIIGLPGALILGLVSGFLEILPNIGPVLAIIPAIIIALIQGSSVFPISNLVFTIIVIIIYLVIQQLENNIIVPRIIGTAMDLHPLVVMLGILVGASAFGILGALLANPIIASGRILVAYSFAKLLDQQPFPELTHPPKDTVIEEGPPAVNPTPSQDTIA